MTLLYQEFETLLDHKKMKELKINNLNNKAFFDKEQKTFLMELRDMKMKKKIQVKNKTNIVF